MPPAPLCGVLEVSVGAVSLTGIEITAHGSPCAYVETMAARVVCQGAIWPAWRGLEVYAVPMACTSLPQASQTRVISWVPDLPMGTSRARRAQPHSNSARVGCMLLSRTLGQHAHELARPCLVPARCAQAGPRTVAQTSGRHGPHITVCSGGVTESGWSTCGVPLYFTCLLARDVQRRHWWQYRFSRHSFYLTQAWRVCKSVLAVQRTCSFCLSCGRQQSCCSPAMLQGQQSCCKYCFSNVGCSVSAPEQRLEPVVRRKHTLYLQPPCACAHIYSFPCSILHFALLCL